MLTVAHCRQAAVWNLVVGLVGFASGLEELPLVGLGRQWRLGAPLWSLVANAHVDESRLKYGMECCLMHSLAYMQVMEVGRRPVFGARALLAK